MTNEFPIGIVSLTNYLLVVARKVSTPGVEAERHSFGPSPSSVNLVFTTLDPVNYYVDFRDSPDGTALGTLIATFTFDAQSNQIIVERRYYTVGGPNVGDPADGDSTITDIYFQDKPVTGVFKEGFRFLKPIDEWTYDNTTYTISVINGTVFSTDEVISVDITYKGALPASTSSGTFAGTLTLTTNTTISATHYNKRLRNKGTAATLVHTFPDLSTIPDGMQFYFSSFGGTQNQTRILLTGTDRIFTDGFNTTLSELPEIWIGKGEWAWLEKNTDSGTPYLEIIGAHAGIFKVGEHAESDLNTAPNLMPEDGRLLDGDEWPRLWYWIKNIQSGTNIITDDTVTGGGYTHPAAKVGEFVIHSTLKKFRMPNTQGMVKKGLKSFTTFGTDTTRDYDYPGGFQADRLKETLIPVRDNGGGGSVADGAFDINSRARGTIALPTTTGNLETTIKNTGVINCRRT